MHCEPVCKLCAMGGAQRPAGRPGGAQPRLSAAELVTGAVFSTAEELLCWHSSRNLPLKVSLVAFCDGLPGSISAVSILLAVSHFTMAWLELGPAVRAQIHRGAVDANQTPSTSITA